MSFLNTTPAPLPYCPHSLHFHTVSIPVNMPAEKLITVTQARFAVGLHWILKTKEFVSPWTAVDTTQNVAASLTYLTDTCRKGCELVCFSTDRGATFEQVFRHASCNKSWVCLKIMHMHSRICGRFIKRLIIHEIWGYTILISLDIELFRFCTQCNNIS